jgi:MFS family permease
MLGIAIYEVGQGSVYIMYEQIGLRSGLEVQEIGEAVGGATLIGLLGGLLALWMGNRFGSARPIVIGITLNVVAASGLAICEDATAYFWLQLLWLFAYAFVLPYVLGVLADMDDKGRWVVAMDAVWWLGDAPGPWVGGWLVESGGYNRLAVLPIVTGVVCVVLFVWLLRRLKVIQEQSPVSGNAGI